MIKKFNLFFLTFFMIGKIKFVPGTIASLITCFLFLALINIKGKTTEKLGLIGKGKAIASEVIASVIKYD